MTKKFYQFINQGTDDTELLIYGDITSLKWFEDDVTAFDFAKELQEVNNPLTVRINSYGGEVSQGLAMYSLLKNFKHKVTTVCDGFACSAASIVFMAGDERKLRSSGLLLIHNAWSSVCGDSNVMRKKADDLEKITKPSIDIYEQVSNLSRDKIKEFMDKETWITAEEALEYGLATEVITDEPKQSIDRSYLMHQVHMNKKLQKKLHTLQEAYNHLEGNKEKPRTGWDAFFGK